MNIKNIKLNTYETKKYHYNNNCKSGLNFYGANNRQLMAYPTIEYWINIHSPEPDKLENIKTIILSNNAKLNLDTNSPDNKVAFEFHTKLQNKPRANEATKIVLARMISNWSEDDKKSVNIGLWNGEELEVIIESNKSNLKETLKETLQSAYQADLTQMQLENAKNEILSEYDTKNQDKAFKYMYGFQGYTKEDIKQVSLDEVKKLYKEITTNSATICSASLPKYTDNNTIRQIQTIIERQIPIQKPFDTKLLIKQVKPLNKNIVLKSQFENNCKTTSKFYTIHDNDTLRDSILFLLAEQALKKIGEENITQDIKSFSCSRSGSFFNKYFEIYAESDNKASNADDYINSVINSLINNILSKEDFDNIKQTVLESRNIEFKESKARASLLSEIYSQGSYGLKEFSNELNSITLEELQQAAQKYFSTPCITEIY